MKGIGVEVLGSATFAEVREVYLRNHDAEQAHEANTNQDGEENLQRADELLGSWWRVRLARTDVLDVVLPWHLSEGGGIELVPRSGLTVRQAVDRIRAGGRTWAEANPVCSTKVGHLKQAPLTPVYLSTLPVSHSDYSDLLVREGLIHLDGLHRMVAWELARRLPRGAWLDAFVAGDVRPRVRTADRTS
ncbi:DUF6309 family protein [Kitasatospora sp. NPDC058218]|uniref:DUF6309 family protein n=1 Tax=Kitasatospora sp. NPDC058218 TaxID=3346385 RepID=UPI0036DBDA86